MQYDTDKLIKSLRSLTCPACDAKKAADNTFCKKCYKQLRPPQRHALYQSAGSPGYGIAFDVAIDALGVTSPVWPEPADQPEPIT